MEWQFIHLEAQRSAVVGILTRTFPIPTLRIAYTGPEFKLVSWIGLRFPTFNERLLFHLS